MARSGHKHAHGSVRRDGEARGREEVIRSHRFGSFRCYYMDAPWSCVGMLTHYYNQWVEKVEKGVVTVASRFIYKLKTYILE